MDDDMLRDLGNLLEAVAAVYSWVSTQCLLLCQCPVETNAQTLTDEEEAQWLIIRIEDGSPYKGF